MSLSQRQIQDIVIIERISSVLSLVGAAFVLTTFLLDGKFRKPINRLVFYATFGNVLTNIATLISTDGIEAGRSSPLCQFQAFLIQWFMPADALWTFAMGCNVWLSFFRSYDAGSLRRLEWKYLIACYGLPFIPAFTYLFVNTYNRGELYGSAVLWCWVALKWDFLRVATFYGPVWIVILLTIGIYAKVGAVIFKWRKQLISMGRDRSADTDKFPATGIIKTSEVTVTRSEATSTGDRPYSVYVLKKSSFPSMSIIRRQPAQSMSYRGGGVDPNKAAVKYCKCALLFFVALIITWVPSTINRIYNIIKPDDIIFGLNLAAGAVLPLQGFWNAAIYTATSSFAVKSLWQRIYGPNSINLPTSSDLRVCTLQHDGDGSELLNTSPRTGSVGLRYDVGRTPSQSELVRQSK